jgi:hypothetical protein
MTDLFQYENDKSEPFTYLLDKTDYLKNTFRQYTRDNSNESTLTCDMLQLSNNDNIIDWSQSFIDLPFMLTVQGTNLVRARPEYTASIKCGVQNLINSVLISYNNNNVNQLNNYANYAMTWEILKMNEDKLKLLADQMLFSLDDVNTYYDDSPSSVGIGEINNVISNNFFINQTTGTGITHDLLVNNFTVGRSDINNPGYVKRCNMCNTQDNEFISIDSLAATASNYIYAEDAGKIIYYMRGIIPLSILSDFFNELGIVMGANIKLELTLNTGRVLIDVLNNEYTDYTSIFSRNNTCPFMISPILEGFDPGLTTTKQTYTISLSIGHSGSKVSAQPDPLCYTKQIRYTPEFLGKFLGDPMKNVIYHDYYTILSNPVESLRSINNYQIISSCSKARYLLIVPIHPTGPLSPFTSQPVSTASHAKLSNFMVYRSNNSLFQQPLNYTYEHYHTNLTKMMSVNGGNMKSPIVSGLISKSMFDKNYSYYCVDLTESKKSEVEDAIAHSYSIEFTNNSKMTLQYMFIIYFERSLMIDKRTSAVIM